MHTIEEKERSAYAAGDAALTDALGRVMDLQRALGRATAEIMALQGDTAHLKRILADALADDSWRQRAQAALED